MVNVVASGNPYEYNITSGDLNGGSRTDNTTRAHVRNPGTFKPANVTFEYKVTDNGNNLKATQAATTISNAITNVNYQPGLWDAGHALARQNGGSGTNTNHVFPQDPETNRGNGGKWGLWRAHEANFHNLVGTHGKGWWKVTTS
jgi:hypothetical protein